MNDLTLAIKLSTAGGQVVVRDLTAIKQSSQQAATAVEGLGNAGEQSAAGLGKASQGSQKLSQDTKQTTSEIDGLRGRMLAMAGVSAALFAGMQAFGAVRALVERADDFNVLQQRIKTATAETNDYNAVSAEMYAIAQRNGAALQPTVELFQRLSTSRKDLKATNDQMLDFTDAVQKLGVIGGSSTMAMEAGLLQLSQGLSGGILRAEEFNSILDNIPELASRIGKGMDDIGKADRDLGLGDLRNLVLEGKLLSDDVLKAILVQLPEIEKQFASMPISVGRAGVMLDNSVSSALARLDQATGSTQAWANAMADVSQALDGMNSEELQNATAALLAVAGFGAALLILSKYGVGLRSVSAAGAGVVVTTVQQTAALLGVSGAAGVATRQITLLGIAGSVASKSLGLLGGPVGLALLAAGAIYQFASSSEVGADKAKLLDDRLKDLNGTYGDLGKAKIKEAVASNAKELADNAARISAINQQMVEGQKAIDFNPASNAAREAYREMGKLKAELTELTAAQTLLGNDSERLAAMYFDFGQGVDLLAEKAATASDDLLKLYNAQMLSAQAVDAQGRALSGIDLELYKANFKDVTKLPQDAESAIKSFAKTAEAAAQLAANDKYLVSLKEEVRLQQIRLTQSEAEYELAKAMSSQKMTDPAQLKQLKELLATQQKLTQAKASKDALTALKTENDLLQIKLSKGEKEYELQKLIRELKVTDPAVIAQLDAEIQRQALLNEQLDVRKYLTDGTYDDLLDGLKQVGDMGGAAGNALVDAFGSVADQFARMAEQQDEFTKKFVTLAEARKKAEKETDPALRAKALAKANAAESGLMEDQYRMQMGNYATLTGAASKMFSENSKGRQVMHRMETTFAAIETALALKKAAANALTAITNQGAGDPYTAFARIAAMAALMAGLGVFSGSASSGTSATTNQQNQGTGTVLGDSTAKSESIANALERIESLELDQYGELRSINTAIRELSAGIKNLAVNLVANYGRFDESNYQGELGKEYNVQLGNTAAAALLGGVIGAAVDNMLGGLLSGITNKVLGGLFGSTKKELVDSGISFAAQELGDILATGLVDATLYDVIKTTKKKAFGLSKSTRENTEYRALDEEVRAEFGRVFSYLGQSVTDAVSLLGLETSKSLEDFVINLPKISFKDLSGDEIEEELNALFSQQGDLMAKYLVPGIAEFQKMGEGLYDTLIRVAQEQAVFNSSLDALGLQLSRFAGVTKQVEIDVAQSLIELMGGIEEFSAATGKYFEEFYSETEQQAYLAKLINEQFAALNLTMPATREQFKSLVDGIDLTTESGQALFAALMSIIDPLDQFYDGVEDAAKAAEKLAQEEKELAEERLAAAQKLAEERAAFIGGLQSELSRLDMTDLERSLDDTKKWYDAQIKEAAELGASTTLLEQLYARKRNDIIQAELDKINADTERQLQTLTTEHETAVSQLAQQYDQLYSAITTAASGIASAILDIRRSMAGWDESGYQAGQITDLRGQLGTGTLQQQIDTISQLQSAIVGKYQADLATNNTLMDAAQQRLDDLNNQWSELTSALASVRSSIASAILDIQRQASGWDEVGYQTGQIADLRSQLGTGSVLEQINTIEQLQAAISNRYNAELDANRALQSAANERYQADLASYNALRDVAKQLTKAADDLLIGELSPLLMGDQFKEAQSQFNDLLKRAQGGDTDAAQQLSGAGSNYLKLAQSYLASGSSEYADIFNQIQSAYRSFGSALPAEPAVPSAVLSYQTKDAELQKAALTELTELQDLLTELEAQAKAEQLAAEAAAKAELQAYQDNALELQTGAITELQALQGLLTALDAQAKAEQQAALVTLTATFEQAKNELLAAAQQQIDAINAVTAAVQNIPAPTPVIVPPQTIIVEPIVVSPPSKDVVIDPPTNPVLEKTNALLQQQLQQAQAAQAATAQQNRQLQNALERTQELLYAQQRIA
ncbi:tape measure protein [Rheinheimera sp.]|uniref:tape measure protein n=1 Tax=Rheinheimera sp. TaxID=1869214 RepID=UPI00307D6D9B